MIQNPGKCTLTKAVVDLSKGGGGGWFLEFALPGYKWLNSGRSSFGGTGGGGDGSKRKLI